MITHELVLDPQLKYWVLVPISIVMVLVGLLKADASVLFSPKPKLTPYKKHREQQFLYQANCFKSNNGVLDQKEFLRMQEYYVQTLKTPKFYAEEVKKEEDLSNAFSELSLNEALMNMATGNMLNFIPQTLIMSWINHFFAGFVIMRLPFPLTDGFKAMLQTGIATPDLNARYVSSISWYFVTLVGLRPIFSLLLDDNSVVDKALAQQQSLPQLGGPGAPKVDKVFNAEAENIQILQCDSIFDGILDRVILQNQISNP